MYAQDLRDCWCNVRRRRRWLWGHPELRFMQRAAIVRRRVCPEHMRLYSQDLPSRGGQLRFNQRRMRAPAQLRHLRWVANVRRWRPRQRLWLLGGGLLEWRGGLWLGGSVGHDFGG